jgi:hypothetical protein
MKTIKASDIVSHGRNLFGLTVFSCYSLGLGSYATTAQGRAAWRAAREYFTAKANA